MILLLYACVLNTGEKLVQGKWATPVLLLFPCRLFLPALLPFEKTFHGWNINTLFLPLELNRLLLLGTYLLLVLFLSVKLSGPFSGAIAKYL